MERRKVTAVNIHNIMSVEWIQCRVLDIRRVVNSSSDEKQSKEEVDTISLQ